MPRTNAKKIEVAPTPKKVDPFGKVKKSTTSGSKTTSDIVTAPSDIAEAVDSYQAAKAQAKHFEGEKEAYGDKVKAFAQKEYARRALHGDVGSFKILGNESTVMYVAQDRSSSLTEENAEAFEKKWGAAARDSLMTKDFASLRFNEDILARHFDAVSAALQAGLPNEVLEQLFKPMTLKPVQGAAVLAKSFAKTPEEYEEIVGKDGLKITMYLK